MKAHEKIQDGPMSVSRRSFVKSVGIGTTAAAIMSFDGSRAWARAASLALPLQERPMLLHNNENPLGPGDRVQRAMNDALAGGPRAGRYPFDVDRELATTIAKMNDVPTDYVMIGNGSTQLLRTATQVFTSPTRPLVTAAPSYEEAPGYAQLIGHPVEALPLDDNMMINLDAMADAARGAGMVFLNNPNNPTATLHDADAVGTLIERVLSETDAMIMVDEAYHDYVTNPRHETQIPRAVQRGPGHRRPYLLQGARHGGHAHRLGRGASGRHPQDAHLALRAEPQHPVAARRDGLDPGPGSYLRRERAETQRPASSPSTGSRPEISMPRTRRQTSFLRRQACRRTLSGLPAPIGTSAWGATSRPTKTSGRASRSARSTTCDVRWTSSALCLPMRA